MDARAHISVSLPRSDPTVPYWQDPPSSIAHHRTTPDLPSTADYVIIGSGISGACIALNLLERKPDAKVVMLEARTACSGATGRNGEPISHPHPLPHEPITIRFAPPRYTPLTNDSNRRPHKERDLPALPPRARRPRSHRRHPHRQTRILKHASGSRPRQAP